MIRPEITTQSRTSHLGIKSCLRKARAFIELWPHTNSNIKEVIFQCPVCAEFHAGNSKEPKQASKVPNCPWSLVAMALFTLQKKEYGCSGGLLLRLC